MDKIKTKVSKWWNENYYDIEQLAWGFGVLTFAYCVGRKAGASKQNKKWSDTLMTIGAKEVGREAFMKQSKVIKF